MKLSLSLEAGSIATKGGLAVAGDTTAPTITSSNTASNAENSVLAKALTADESVTWTITGGADAARFEISGSTLRWASNGTKDFEAPNDANTDNVYVVQVTATDPSSNATNQTISVTVTDVYDTTSWQIVGTYGDIGFATQTVTAGQVENFTKTPIDLAVAVTSLKVLSHAFIVSGASGGLDTALANDIAVKHAWNIGGVMTVDGSSTNVTAGNGATLSSTIVTSQAAGTRIWLNRIAIAPATSAALYQALPTAAGSTPTGMGRANYATTLGDAQLGTASPAGLASTAIRTTFRAVIGLGVHGYTFNVLGDSIAYNNSDTNIGDGGASGVDGRTITGGAWVRRAFMTASAAKGSQIPFAMSARTITEMGAMRTNGAARRALSPYHSVLIIQMGTNDLNNGVTAATLKTYVEAEIVDYKAAFSAANPTITPKAIVCTLLPRQATAGGTTSKPEFITYNGYVRAGSISGSDGYLDPNITVRKTTGGVDDSIWETSSNTSDGTHPTTAGHAAIAAAEMVILQQAPPWRVF